MMLFSVVKQLITVFSPIMCWKYGVLWSRKVWSFDEVPFIYFFFSHLRFWCHIQETIANPWRSWGFTLVFSFKYWVVLALTFKSLIHFEFLFYVWCKVRVQLHSFARGYPVPAPFVEKTIFSLHWMVMAPLVKNQLTIDARVYFWILKSIPLVPKSTLMPIPHSLLLYLCKKFWNWEVWFLQLLSSLLFFLSLVAILSPLHYYMNFRISLSITAKKNAFGILIGAALSLWSIW